MTSAVSGTGGRAIVTSDSEADLAARVAEWVGCGWRADGAPYCPGRGVWAQRMCFKPSGPEPEDRTHAPAGYHVAQRAHTGRWGWEDMRGWDSGALSRMSPRDYTTMEAAVASAWKDSERKA